MQRIAALNKQQVTAVTYLDERVIRNEVIDVSNEMEYTDLMTLAGLKEKTIFPQYYQFTDENDYKALIIDTGGVTGSGTASMTITTTVATAGYARKNMVLKFADDTVGYISSAITTSGGKDTFTVTSATGGNMTAAAAQKIIDLGISAGEASTSVENINYTVNSDFNLITRLRDIDVVTDVQKESYVTVEVNGVKQFTAYNALKKARAFQGNISVSLFGQKKSAKLYGDSVPLVDAQGNPTQFTGGIDEEIATKGQALAWTTNGSFVLADLDNECDSLNAIKAPTQYLKLCPDKARRAISTYAKGLGSSGVTSAKLNFGANEITAFNYVVDQITHGKYTFEYGTLPMLDHPDKFAAAGTIGKSIYGIPKGKVNTVGNGAVDRIRVRYMNHGIAEAGSNWIAEWYTGAMAPGGATDDKASLTRHWLCNFGNEMAGTKQFSKQRALA